MQVGVRHTGIPLGSLIKVFCVGYVIGSAIIACVWFIVALLISHPSVSFAASGGPLAILTGVGLGLVGLVFQAFVMALITAFGLWLYSRWRGIEVFLLD